MPCRLQGVGGLWCFAGEAVFDLGKLPNLVN